ncbi:MAG: MFS transporter [Alphaproteobacteria bacterium]|nr:MFS transporter [Alphaproteobacteria bacterium]
MQHRISGADLAKITSLLATAAIMLLANGLQGTLVPIRGHLEGFSATSLSLQGFAYFTGFVAGCLGCPYLIARSGHIRSFAILTALTTAAVLLLPLIIGGWSWAILRAAIGFCAAGMFSIIEGWLNQQVPNEKRGRIFTTYAAINNLALLGGQYLFTLADRRGDVLFIGCAILTVACLIPIGLTRQTEPQRVALPKLRVVHLLRVSPVGVVGAAIVGLASGAFWILAPIYAEYRGLAGNGVALFMSMVILGGALAQWPVGRLSDFTDRRFVIGCAAAGAAFAGIMLAIPVPFAIGPHAWLLAGGFLYGMTAFPIGSMTNAHLNDHAKHEEMTETAASNLFVYGTAAMVGPLIAAAVVQVGGLSAVFYYTAAMHSCLLLFVIYRTLVRAPIASQERGAFNVPTTQGPGAIHFAPASEQTTEEAKSETAA